MTEEAAPLPGQEDRPWLAAGAAALAAILVGSGIVVTRFVIEQTHPASLALLRYAIGFACLLVPVAAPQVEEEEAGLRLRFVLPPGSYATVLLHEVTGSA